MSQAGSVKSEPAQSEVNGRVTSPGQKSSGAAVGRGGVNERPEKQDDMASGQRMIFSGPNSLRQHRVTVPDSVMWVGIGERSPEVTSEVAYLSRPAPDTPFPMCRSRHVGEVGWTVEFFSGVTGKEQIVTPPTR
ncbi:uncharacterized protein LOC135468540 [Liolophura sinensis]|uniref:uncharacterized protein LOC135468540 n=1 Tax=Liolophura sinensis TaxID=3198878 RepID=UPI0031581186